MMLLLLLLVMMMDSVRIVIVNDRLEIGRRLHVRGVISIYEGACERLLLLLPLLLLRILRLLLLLLVADGAARRFGVG